MSNTQIVDIKVGDLIVTTAEYHASYNVWHWHNYVDFNIGEIVARQHLRFVIHPVDVASMPMAFSDAWFQVEKPYFKKLYVKQS